MSRKKLKAFDPGNSNKAQREQYQRLQEGSTPRDLAPRVSHGESDGNAAQRLTGAARRFAMQLLVSKKLDARDQAKARGQKINAVPDYRQRLQEQIAAKAAQQQKTLAKAERRKAAAEARANGLPLPAAAGSAVSLSAPAAKPAASHAAASSLAHQPSQPSANGVVSLSKSVEQQRQSKRDRKQHSQLQADLNAEKAAAAEAQAAAAEAAAAAAGSAGFDESESKAAPKIKFNTEMRPGESFRSYQARIVAEKARLMNAEVDAGGKGLSERKKRKLAEKEQRRKEKKDTSLDPAERRVRAEREAKEALDRARGETRTSADPALQKQRNGPTEFAGHEQVAFGEVADRPPTLSVVPKSKTLAGEISNDRIIDNLLLMQQKKRRKDGKPEMDELEKAEWIEKQRDLSRRTQAAEEQKARDIDALREASIKAYKESKKRRREEEAEEKLAPTKKKDEPYVKKSVLKKQKRNRERLQAFKDAADLELDMDIEMADQFD